jgi:hypothetical protein
LKVKSTEKKHQIMGKSIEATKGDKYEKTWKTLDWLSWTNNYDRRPFYVWSSRTVSQLWHLPVRGYRIFVADTLCLHFWKPCRHPAMGWALASWSSVAWSLHAVTLYGSKGLPASLISALTYWNTSTFSYFPSVSLLDSS